MVSNQHGVKMKVQNILLSLIAVILAVIAFFLYSSWKIANDEFLAKQQAELQKAQELADQKSEEPESPVSAAPSLCFAFDVDSIGHCKKGDRLIFMPSRWGNDQLPIVVAGNNCDFDKAVVYNNGGVACIKLTDPLPKE